MGQDAMSYGDEVEAIALPHLPTMDFPGPKCCHPRAPRMTLVRHANCQACPSEPPDGLLTFTRTSGVCGRRDTPQTRGTSARRPRELKQLFFAVGTSRDSGEYYVISIQSEDANMSIRKSILTTLAVALIGTAPAWSQSLLKT